MKSLSFPINILYALFFLFINAQAIAEDINPTDFFQQNIKTALEKIKSDSQVFRKKLVLEKKKLEELKSPTNPYAIKINFIETFLIMPNTDIILFEKNLQELNVLETAISSDLDGIEKNLNSLDIKITDIREKIKLIDERKVFLQNSHSENGIQTSTLDTYKNSFSEYRKNIETLFSILMSQKEILHQDRVKLGQLRDKLKIKLKQKKGDAIFHRDEKPFYRINIKTFFLQIKEIVLTSLEVIYPENIKIRFFLLKNSLDILHILILILFAGTLYGYRKLIKWLLQQNRFAEFYHSRRGLLLKLFTNVFTIIASIILIHIFTKTRIYPVFPAFINFLRDWTLLVLFTKIASITIHMIIRNENREEFDFLLWWTVFFIAGIRTYAFIYFFMYWFFGASNIILMPARIIFELILTAGCLFFWKRYDKHVKEKINLEKILKYWSFGVLFTGLILDIAGYRILSSVWFTSWGLSLVVICASFVFFHSLLDVEKCFKDKFSKEVNLAYGISYPIYWIASRWIYFVAGFAALAGIAWSWGVSEYFFSGVHFIIYKEYKFSGLTLSLANILYAMLFLTATNLFVKVWKRFISNKILDPSNIQEGVKQSVVSISSYFIWTASILMSLNILGISATSLAVAFGALGVGLGFGLQNIFNNFISGIILLLERPVQVGDIVEINGLFGIVENINVRSTIVQTYSNASIIIPNSELISSQVTNWSHKDPYIRRDVTVGVAYGSNPDLVKKLLLQATDKVQDIKIYPEKPVIYFSDFGDNSLNFLIRFWADLNHYRSAESNLRFVINKIFKENNIEIPFPQRDIHIRTNQGS